jgi:hypothetical protein
MKKIPIFPDEMGMQFLCEQFMGGMPDKSGSWPS